MLCSVSLSHMCVYTISPLALLGRMPCVSPVTKVRRSKPERSLDETAEHEVEERGFCFRNIFSATLVFYFWTLGNFGSMLLVLCCTEPHTHLGAQTDTMEKYSSPSYHFFCYRSCV